MQKMLPHLLDELEQNCRAVQCILMEREFDPPVDAYALSLYRQVEKLRREIAQLRNDPALCSRPLLAQQVQEYKGLVREMIKVEGYFLPVVTRFAAPDIYMTNLCALMMRQANITLTPPLVATFSTEYYWTQPHLNLVCAGALECTTLLGLPDLYHEVGHLIFYQHYALFSKGFLSELQRHVAQEKRRALLDQRPIAPTIYDDLLVQWKDSWFNEFAADMTATYLVGEAYGWQHLRLCSRMSDELYRPSLGESASHPADDARTRAIVLMLRRMGQAAPAQAIESRWASYARSLQAFPASPGDYSQCYPDGLLEKLAEVTLNTCETLTLVPFTRQRPDDTIAIAVLINEAWSRFLSNSADYAPWEQDKIEKLHHLCQ